ncbi:uncharacterized protein LOC120003586 [Tripterygium wilfordii]|uniref:uncharacterized protein LOC120003586 n=1 Tax=Tripterygium wilfordii TaxID=458696 RepID=UPI0018F81019|nr:uncharacterized protein LOC120003586 [Tripterygium wilfordii]
MSKEKLSKKTIKYTSSCYGGRNYGYQFSRGSGRYQPHSFRPTGAPQAYTGILGPSPSPDVCQICDIPGHRADQCYHRYNTACTPNDLPRSFAAMSVGETNDSSWYPDSGASTHMTPHEGQAPGDNSSQSHR